MAICKVSGCHKPAVGRGCCSKHYYRLMRHGSPDAVKQIVGSDEERFWSKVDRRSPNECWPWMAKSRISGYGVITMGGRLGRHKLAHRVAWEFTNGPIPSGEGYHGTVVMHECDNRLCCNPAHMKLGTQLDNVRDMDGKGRASRGNSPVGRGHPNAKLTDESVVFIRCSDAGHTELARRFGVDKATISRIRKRQTWKHVL